MPNQAEKKTSILITGCSSGIGRYCAEQLHAAGYQVIASCRKREDVAQLKEQGLVCVQLDVTDARSIKAALEEVLVITGGTIDVLFNNAGYGQGGAIEDLPTHALRAQFETNVFGLHELTHAVIPIMLKQGQGKIVQNSSVLGLVGMKYRGAYNASKFALEGYTDTLRLELMDTNITVSLIEPGPIVSQFRANSLRAVQKEIDIDGSRHKSRYQQTLARLGAAESTNGFTLGPEAVLKPLQHILDNAQPKPRYYVTKSTYIFGYLRRFLSTKWLDRILVKGN
ncbi:short-chain dehydrogenase [Vibrio sp. 10N.286.49.B3]|uniref:SDR family oxidoreductase n=1 Tax=Vibrio sp. 10N.286.49.B3 TaxID=1880855 RepID=UPI000C861A73|nr:SDR family oxidoreductase [Vibrio sp. 10N.286.49.B3]PMH42219.1 short-chain dehydrogenase [Vibrio sp. 10N.286.49.B3]